MSLPLYEFKASVGKGDIQNLSIDQASQKQIGRFNTTLKIVPKPEKELRLTSLLKKETDICPIIRSKEEEQIQEQNFFKNMSEEELLQYEKDRFKE